MTEPSSNSSKTKLFISLMVVPMIAIIFSCFTFWLVDSWIKYPFFVLEVFVVMVIYLISKNHDYSTSLKFTFLTTVSHWLQRCGNFEKYPLAGITLIIFSSVLLISNALDFGSNIIQLALAFLCISFLSGYCLLGTCNLIQYFSRLESIILSFITSFVFSGFSLLFLIHLEEHTRDNIFSIIFISTGIIFIVNKSSRQAKGQKLKDFNVHTVVKRPASFIKKIDILAIILCISFYCLFFILLYPNAALLPSADIARHYSYSGILLTSPDVYTGFNYLIFHSYLAALNVLSGMNQPLDHIQTIPIILNLLLPISIYVLGKRFFSSVDKRIPALATIFYTFFSNLSFIYLSQLKVIEVKSTDINLFLEASEKSFNGLINFLQPFLYLTPQSVSFIILMFAFMLLRVNNVPKIELVAIFTILVLSMYLIHVSEAIVFMIVVMFCSFFSKYNEINAKNALLGSLIGSTAIILFLLYNRLVWPAQLFNTTSIVELDNSTLILYIVFILLCITLLLKTNLSPKPFTKFVFLRIFLIQIQNYFSSNSRFFILILTGILTFIFLFGLIIWFVTDDFRYSLVSKSGFIPWFLYPVTLGVTGLLAILSLKYLQDIWTNNRIAIGLVLLILTITFLIGRSISFVNVNLMSTGYWEIRLIIIVFVFLSLIAPIPLIKLVDSLNLRKRKLLTTVVILIVVSSIVLLGLSSLMLQTEFWYMRTSNEKKNISEKEWEAIAYLKNILQKDPHAYTISPSEYSNHLLNFAPAYKFLKPNLITQSKYPDIPLLSLSAYHLDHAYLYVHARDENALSENPQNWLTGHLLSTLPKVYSNEDVTIYNVTNVSYPVSNSNTGLVIPTDSLNNYRGWSWYVNDILSQSQAGSINYTEILDTDPQIFKNKNLILSFDPSFDHDRTFYDNFSQVHANKTDNKYIRWDDISGNWSYTLKGLHGGIEANDKSTSISPMNNIILSPFTLQNLSTVTTSFTVNEVNRSFPNYASIVFSFQDPKNYRQGGINIYGNDVYVLFSNITNGMTQDSLWPGQKTNLTLNPDINYFNMSLSIEGSTERLTLNGTEYLNPHLNPINGNKEESTDNNGNMGLSYGRIKNIDFHDFVFYDYDKIDQRELIDYIQYAESGGNLFVFNTNGYGSVANYLFNALPTTPAALDLNNTLTDTQKHGEISGNYSKIKTTLGKYILNLHDAKDKKLINENITIFKYTDQYMDMNSSVSIFEKQLGQGTITYIDIYPILFSSFGNNTLPTNLSNFLNNISHILPLEQLELEPTNFKDLNAFQTMNGSGNFQINTPSIIFHDDKIQEIEIKQRVRDNDYQIYKFVNVTNLDISNYDYALINVTDSQIRLNDGRGLYSNILLEGRNLTFYKFLMDDALIQGISNNIPFEIDNITSMSIKGHNQPIMMYVKQPHLTVEGYILLQNHYSFDSYITPSQIPEKNLLVNGTFMFNIFMSDYYTLISDVYTTGHVQSVPIFKYDDINLTNLVSMIPKLLSIPLHILILLFIPFCLVFAIVIFASPKITK
jgi:hypothetical protein